MEIVKKCEWCHKTFIGQMVTARFCSSKCCDQAYRYKRKVQSGKYTPADSNIDLSTLLRGSKASGCLPKYNLQLSCATRIKGKAVSRKDYYQKE